MGGSRRQGPEPKQSWQSRWRAELAPLPSFGPKSPESRQDQAATTARPWAFRPGPGVQSPG